MNLYEIDSTIQALVDPDTGELMDYDVFAALQMERTQKIENVALWVKDLLAEASAIKAEEDSLKARRQSAERKANRLKTYLAEALRGEPFKTARCAISYRKSSALQVENTSQAAEWLESNGYMDLVVRKSPDIDKRAVFALIKDGVPVLGCEVVERSTLQLR